MIAVRWYGKGESKDLDSAEISDVIDQPECVVWIDVVDPAEGDLSCLQQEFQLHPLAIEDVLHRHQRPKLEHYPTHAFIVAYTADLHEVDFFLGSNWVVTVRTTEDDTPPWSPDSALARFERTRNGTGTSAFLLYALLDEIVDGYFRATDKAEDALEDLEERIFAEELQDERTTQQQLFNVRRRLLEFRRAVVPLREVVGTMLRGEVKWVDETTKTHLQDVYDHVLRATDALDSQRELMGNAVDAHLAIISNRMNRVMKRMTSWGAILLLASLVAGLYGMNFVYLPGTGLRHGYLWALGAMAVVTAAGVWYFSRKDWL